MQNTDQTKRNNEMPGKPQPNEEVQQNIETVVPDSEQPEVGSESGSAVVGESNQSPEVGQSKRGSLEVGEDSASPEVGESEEENSEPDDQHTKDQDSGDARDQVETVST